jgi:predicted DNA-binding protein with PD1-like motif
MEAGEKRMKTKLLQQEGGLRTYVVVLEIGDEIMSCLGKVARSERLSAAQITAIGAFSEATLLFFDWEIREYQPIPVTEQTEVAALIGDIALDREGEPALHVHAVLGKRDGTAIAGHLKQAHVRPTLEILINESPAHLRRLHDPRTGLALLQPQE